jgi:hypothetical protein
MSLLSQFFPAGASSDRIVAEVLLLGGGGGGGFSPFPLNPNAPTGFSAGPGGPSSIVYSKWIEFEPGKTYPITIGAAGGGAPASTSNGTNGGDSTITFPNGYKLTSYGGGGGLSYPNPVPVSTVISSPGGSAGGAIIAFSGSFGLGDSAVGSNINEGIFGTFIRASSKNYPTLISNSGVNASTQFGVGSVPGGPPMGKIYTTGDAVPFSITGSSVSYASRYPGPGTPATSYGSGGSAQSGSTSYGSPNPPGAGFNGLGGYFVIKYPDVYAAAPAFPGGTDLSPTNPGFRCYAFTGNGSITLP